jgi:transposase
LIAPRPSFSARHLASWAALCPGHHQSAGRQKSGRTRKGNRWLRATLVQAAVGAIGTRDCALAARYRRLVRHTGHNKAVGCCTRPLLDQKLQSARTPLRGGITGKQLPVEREAG